MYIIVHLRSGGRVTTDEMSIEEDDSTASVEATAAQIKTLIQLLENINSISYFSVQADGSTFYIHPDDISTVELVGYADFMDDIECRLN